jgi:FkbM family methyltransferase
MKIEMVNARNKYGDFWTHAVTPLSPFFVRRTKWFKDLTYEAPVVGILESGAYSLLVDVGAGWGYHTIIAAHHCKTVLALESNAIRFGILCWNTQMLRNVDRRWVFIGTRGQKARRSANPWKPIESVQPEIDLDAVTLDGLLTHRKDSLLEGGRGLVKIDVEGSEIDVLKGGADLLCDRRFDWLVEVHECVGIAFADIDGFMGPRKPEILSKKHVVYRWPKVPDE